MKLCVVLLSLVFSPSSSAECDLIRAVGQKDGLTSLTRADLVWSGAGDLFGSETLDQFETTILISQYYQCTGGEWDFSSVWATRKSYFSSTYKLYFTVNVRAKEKGDLNLVPVVCEVRPQYGQNDTFIELEVSSCTRTDKNISIDHPSSLHSGNVEIINPTSISYRERY